MGTGPYQRSGAPAVFHASGATLERFLTEACTMSGQARTVASDLRNQLLTALPLEEREAILRASEHVTLPYGRVLFDVAEPITHVYFPETALVSLLGTDADGVSVEVGVVGHDGVAGLPIFLGADRTHARAMIQVSGELWVMPADAFRRAAAPGSELDAILRRYTQALYFFTAQSSACNRMHRVVQRCARWLLSTQDLVGSPRFRLTHLVLSQMLGVRRATVTETMGEFQRAGLISYNRGLVTILDRERVERTACSCYALIQREKDSLLKPRSP